MTTLYFRAGTCALAPHVVLEWIGAPYEAVPVKAGSPALLALNPAGAVPVLKEDDGWILTQNGAILHYLVAKHPDAGLAGGASIQAEAEANRWASFITGDLHPAFFPVFMASRYTTDPSDEAQVEVQQAGLALVRKRLDLIEAHLAGREWFLETRSIIDAYALPMLRWARSKLPEHLDTWPATAALLDKLEADPAVQRVLEVHRASA